MENFIDQLVIFAASYGLKIIGAALILIFGRVLAGFARKGVKRFLQKSKTDEALISLAYEVIQKELKDDQRILSDPAPQIAVSELADSSVNFVVRPWVKGEDYWDVRFDLTRKIKEKFDDSGIEIPFPQQVVHISQEAEI